MRLIDADALGVGRCSKDVLPAAYCAGWNGLIELIENAPTVDAVPVVRCKDCKHRSDRLYCRLRKQPAIVVNTDFCSHGERKEGVE